MAAAVERKASPGDYYEDEKTGTYPVGTQTDLAHRPSKVTGTDAFAAATINKRLLLINAWNLLGPMSTGYMAAVIAACFYQASFIEKFALATRPNASLIIGAMASSMNCGATVGFFVSSWVSTKYGRKKAFMFNCLFYVLGAALSAGAPNVTAFCLGRMFSGFGGWPNMLNAVAFNSELATPARRGVLGGAMGVALTTGYVIAGWTTVGFFYYQSVNTWRAPLLIQILFPVLLLAGIYWVPESPRWLALKGREEEALEVMKRIHHSENDPDFIVAREEHYQIVAQARLDKTLDASWKAMYTTYWRRSAVTLMVTAGNQSTGIQFCTNYNVVLFASLGFTGATPLILQGGWLLAAFFSDLFWASLLDKVGRRPLIIWQPPACTAVMAVIVGLFATYSGTDHKAGLNAIAAMVFIFVFIFSMDEPAEFVYMSEIFPTHVRTNGIALGCASIMLTGVWLTMSSPIGLATIGWRYYLVFVALGVFYTIIQLPFVKETKGLPLEEIDAVFGDGENVAVYSRDIVLDSTGVHAKSDAQVV